MRPEEKQMQDYLEEKAGRKMLTIEWKGGAEVRVRADGGEAVISANKEGMLSLAAQLAALAEASPGYHIHYDAYDTLEEGSADLIIERIP